MTISSRSKGKRAELEVIHILHTHGWGLAHRTSDGRSQGARGDIADGPAGVHIECKRSERLNICAALDQAIRDAHGLDIPVVVHRPSRHVWMATLPLEELLPLLRLKEFG